jgi:tetratricopeptide (TPR) repeat protein
VQCKWWKRRCVQQSQEAEGQVFGAVFASAGSTGPASDILLSAASMNAWPAVVNGIVDMLAIPQATISGLVALNMIASESDTRDWVLQKKDAVCRSVESVFFGDSSRLDADSCAKQVMIATDVFRALGWLEEALHLLYKLQKFPLLSSRCLVAASCKSSISGIFRDMGWHDEALVEQKAALDIQQAVLGERHPDVASNYRSIGITLMKLGRNDEALVEQKRALDIQQAAQGEHHPDVASSHHNIGITLKKLGRYDEALVEQKAALGRLCWESATLMLQAVAIILASLWGIWAGVMRRLLSSKQS